MTEEQLRISKLLAKAVCLLDIINAEWVSDPHSVQCFDIAIRKQVQDVINEYNKMEESLGSNKNTRKDR